MFWCRHTEIYRVVRNLQRDTVGAVLREYLYEDVACLVEDFAFTRSCEGRLRPQLMQCVREGDYDGVLYFSLALPACVLSTAVSLSVVCFML